MTNLKPSDFVKKWPRELVVRRLITCTSMLHAHGFLTDGEMRRVQARLVKWVDEYFRKKGRTP